MWHRLVGRIGELGRAKPPRTRAVLAKGLLRVHKRQQLVLPFPLRDDLRFPALRDEPWLTAPGAHRVLLDTE